MTAIKPRILCIDDKPEILRFLDAVLSPNGYEVIKTRNGEEALDSLEKQNIDLVLSDVRMLKMDGFEVCRRIKGDDRFPTLPVSSLSHPSASVVIHCQGIRNLLSKSMPPARRDYSTWGMVIGNLIGKRPRLMRSSVERWCLP